MATADWVSRRRLLPDRQQPSGKRNQTLRDRPEKLAVLRQRQRRKGQCQPLQFDRNGQDKWLGAVCVS